MSIENRLIFRLIFNFNSLRDFEKMGADGGTIPKRCELVKKKKKIEKIGRDVKNASKWRTCQVSAFHFNF